MARLQSFFLFSAIVLAPFARAEETSCISFARLPETFQKEFGLDGKARVRFVPFDFPVGSSAVSTKGFVLQDEESCGIWGNCDSIVFLSADQDGKRCYRRVLSFKGNWGGVAKAEKRSPASIRVGFRRFEFDERNYRFEEKAPEMKSRKK